MTLNIDKNKDALVSAWREVMDEKHLTNWALFGYDGLSYDLNLIGKGDGGVEELIEDFNSGKIMYALCRVRLKEKNVEKIALINWQGEGAPLSRKGTCANHVSDVKNFFKGVHVTINARTDEDVEPEVIVQTVAKATAGDGVKHSMSSDVDSQGVIGPVGTVYKRVNPMDDINSAAKDEFWKKEEQEEERRKRDEQNKLRKFSQNEVKLLRRESQEYFNESETVTRQSVNKVTSVNTTNQLNGSNNISSAAAIKASTPTKSSVSGSSGDLVRQRIKSFDHGTPTSPLYYNNTTSSSNGVNGNTNGNGSSESLSVLKRRQLFEGGVSTSAYTAPVKKNPAQEIKLAQEKAQKEQQQKQSDLKPNASPVVNIDKVDSITPLTPSIDKYSNQTIASTPPPTEPIRKSISPVSSDSAQTVVLTESLKSDNSNGYFNGSNNREDVFIDDSVHSGESVQENLEILPGNERESAVTPSLEILPEMGICARALYDYQAADDSEITFDPGEVITNIEQIDEGWWEGMGPRGVYGLFPANYVELLN